MKRLDVSLNRWGKAWGLRRLANADGHFTMVAIDQRPPIIDLIARARGVPPQAVGFDDVVRVKALLAEGLAAHASALLVDPNFGLPAASAHLQPQRGLVVTLEEHRYGQEAEGRRSGLIPDWSVEQIRRLGADAVKLLAWYRPDASPAVCAHQQALVRAVGDACRAHDIAFVLELLVYPLGALAAVNYEEDAGKQASLVIDSVAAFADPVYGVDLFKLESPLPMASLPEPDSPAASRVQARFDEMGRACGATPWVMLSAGAGPQAFERAITFAGRAGASGFLAGRAVWAETLQAWPDEGAVRRALREDAVPLLQRLCSNVARTAAPVAPVWRFDAIRAEGDVCRVRGAVA